MPRLAPMIALPAVAALAVAGAAHGGTATRSATTETSCAPGSYSVVTSPDGTSVSILFDDLSLSPDAAKGAAVYRKSCHIQAPLHLPAGYSLGMYRVDYRGFAHLDRGQVANIAVDYNLGQPQRRMFGGMVGGPRDGTFTFTETIPPGLMKRVGCGDNAVLDLTARLEMMSMKSGSAVVTMDSVDGGPAVTYRFDLKKC